MHFTFSAIIFFFFAEQGNRRWSFNAALENIVMCLTNFDLFKVLYFDCKVLHFFSINKGYCNQWRKELNRTNVKWMCVGRVGGGIPSKIVKRPTRNVALGAALLSDITGEP